MAIAQATKKRIETLEQQLPESGEPKYPCIWLVSPDRKVQALFWVHPYYRSDPDDKKSYRPEYEVLITGNGRRQNTQSEAG